MPSKNIIKEYVEGGIYHVYNRGVEKRDIFNSKKDYAVFMFLLKHYLLSEDDPLREKPTFGQGRTLTRVRRSFYGRIELLTFCLMPNHFHLIVKQTGQNDLTDFMKCLATSYSMYFNKKNDRVGSLFQGRYKAILVKDDSYLLHLSRYIHLNPVDIVEDRDLLQYDFSSYKDYIGLRNTKWIKTDLILSYFEENKNTEIMKSNSYKSFVENYEHNSYELLGEVALE